MMEKEYIKSVVDYLAIKGMSLNCNGLWYGRMGVVIFFHYYAKYTGTEQFKALAMELFKQVKSEIQRDMPANYARGMSGIGTSIEFLAQNEFLGLKYESLKNVDARIFFWDIISKQHEDSSLSTGLTGFGQYFLTRVNRLQTPNNELNLLINKERLLHVVNIFEHTISSTDPHLPDILSFLCRLYCMDICNPKIERCINKVQSVFSTNKTPAGSRSEMALAFMQMTILYNHIEEFARQSAIRILHNISQTDSLSMTKTAEGDDIGIIFWLMRVRRIACKTGLVTDLLPQVNQLTGRYLKKIMNYGFEEGRLSLKGCAGVALALMTVTGEMDDNWLDLLG